MATTTNYYGLSKPSYNEVADIEVINANMDKIDTQMKNNSDGVNFAKGISSDAYDNSRPYAVGDYCIYDNKLYRCITAIKSAEAFNVEKWRQTTVGNEVNQLNSNLSNSILFFDYNNGTKITPSSTSFVAPSNGLLTGAINTNSGDECHIYVNEKFITRVRDSTNTTATNCTPFSIILSKGDIIQISGSVAFSDQVYFYPCKSLG